MKKEFYPDEGATKWCVYLLWTAFGRQRGEFAHCLELWVKAARWQRIEIKIKQRLVVACSVAPLVKSDIPRPIGPLFHFCNGNK